MIKTFLAALLALSFSTNGQNPCIEVSYPNMARDDRRVASGNMSDLDGYTVDMAEWMTMDPAIASTNHLEPETHGNVNFSDKIVWTKFDLVGGNSDAWSFDENFVYFYKTGTNTDYVKSPDGTAPLVPRLVQMGMPGVRVVNLCNQFQIVTKCVKAPVGPGGNTVVEVWGPFVHTFAGNIGTQTIVSMKSYWDCWGREPNTCTQLEEFWYTRPYGWVQWRYYTAPLRDGNFQLVQTNPFDSLIPGASNFIMWCE